MFFTRKTEMKFEYKHRDITIPILYSNRKSLSIEVRPDLSVLIKAPKGVPFYTIERLVHNKTDWISKKLNEYESAPERLSFTLSEEAKKQYRKTARTVITGTVSRYAALMQVSYGRIAIREQKTCWGSCSSKKNLNFNWKLVLMPEEIMEYVVVHELAHLMELNHSKAFWKIVEEVLPDYKSRKQWLKENGKFY